MERQTAYGDANMNPYAVAQMQQFSVHRMQRNPGINSYSGRVDSYLAEEERSYSSSEGQWHWERDTQPMSPHLYREGHGGNANRSPCLHQGGELKLGSSLEPGAHSQERDMAIGAQDSASQSFEALEKKFAVDIMKMAKEHMDAEDAENIRHRERIVTINNEYQQKLEALRARHAARREEFLRSESQARLQQYHLAGMAHYPNNSTVNRGAGFGVGVGGPGTVLGEAQRPFAGTGQYYSHRQQRPTESFGRGRMQGRGGEGRVPHSAGRLYDTGPRYY